jgi:hypothetical protein
MERGNENLVRAYRKFKVLGLKDLALHYEVEENRSTERLEISIAHLTKKFDGMKAVSIGTSQINEYIKDRHEQGAANGTSY